MRTPMHGSLKIRGLTAGLEGYISETVQDTASDTIND